MSAEFLHPAIEGPHRFAGLLLPRSHTLGHRFVIHQNIPNDVLFAVFLLLPRWRVSGVFEFNEAALPVSP